MKIKFFGRQESKGKKNEKKIWELYRAIGFSVKSEKQVKPQFARPWFSWKPNKEEPKRTNKVEETQLRINE